MSGVFQEHGCTSSKRVRHGYNLPTCLSSVQFSCSFLEVKKTLLGCKTAVCFLFWELLLSQSCVVETFCCIICPAQSVSNYFIACFWPQSNSKAKLKEIEVIYINSIASLGNTVKTFQRDFILFPNYSNLKWSSMQSVFSGRLSSKLHLLLMSEIWMHIHDYSITMMLWTETALVTVILSETCPNTEFCCSCSTPPPPPKQN